MEKGINAERKGELGWYEYSDEVTNDKDIKNAKERAHVVEARAVPLTVGREQGRDEATTPCCPVRSAE